MGERTPKPLKQARKQRAEYVKTLVRKGFPHSAADRLTWIEFQNNPPRLVVCAAIDKGRLWSWQIESLKRDYPNADSFPWTIASTWTETFPLSKEDVQAISGQIYILNGLARIE